MLTRVFISGFAASTCLIIGVFVLYKDRKKPLNRYFFLFNLCIFFWNSSDFIGPFLASNPKLLLAFYRYTYIGGVILVPVFIQMISYLIPDLKFSKTENLFKKFIYLSTVILLVFIPTNQIIKSVVFVDTLQESPGNLYIYFVIYFVSGFLFNLYRLFLGYKNSEERKKLQLKYFFPGLSLTLACASLAFLTIGYGVSYIYFYLFEIGYTALSAYAITKHELMDIKLVITTTIAYCLTIFAALSLIILIDHNLPYRLFFILLAVAVFTTFGNQINTGLRKLLNHSFIPDFYDPEKIKDSILKESALISDRTKLFKTLVKEIRKTVKVQKTFYYQSNRDSIDSAKITHYKKQDTDNEKILVSSPFIKYLYEKKTPEERKSFRIKKLSKEIREALTDAEEHNDILEYEVCIPIYSYSNLEAFIVTGEKDSHNNFTPDDFDTFDKIIKLARMIIDRIMLHLDLNKTQIIAETATTHKNFVDMSKQIAHEINNPMTVIRMGAKHLIRYLKDQTIEKKDLIMTIIDQILDEAELTR
ncbi:MAG: hypothetical protein GY730_01715, partial [bacterium]|nr:hypothetical protein [bacterium]